jgi:site-specific recombinase XerD
MAELSAVRVRGPLEPFAAGFGVELVRLGYTPFSARGQLELAAHLSRWLAEQHLEVADLTAQVVESFLTARRAAGYRAYRSAKALVPLLAYLRACDVVPLEPPAMPAGPAEVLLEEFGRYLLVERGLEARVIRGYLDLVRPFVAGLADRQATGDGLVEVRAGDVTGFLVEQSRRLAPKTVQRLASALRSLLGWWHLNGTVAVSLVEAVPKVACRTAAMPRALPPVQVEALLASCDLGRPDGLRDFAAIMLMARLGLRCAEVAGLQLDDVDWRAGVLTVRGKGMRRDQLPLPPEVGQAITAYLRAGRPDDALDRSLIIRIKAPHRGLTSTGVTQAVAAAGRRAGLPGTIYAHRLRHSAATAMLGAGAPLAEIGQVLRHRRASTTALYAKVDLEALRTLARPWPGAS